MQNKKIILLGLDGATWDLIKPWIEDNKLPTFNKLVEQGSFGNLESTIPNVTPPAWTSMTTGKNPGKHGIFDFIAIEKKDNHWENKLYSSTNKKSEEIWDLFDKKSIIVNVPLTFPPKKINGIMITGMYTPDEKHDFTYPAEIKNELFEVSSKYITDLKCEKYKGKKKKFLSDLYIMTSEGIKIFWHLYQKEWDFYFFVFVGTDRIQHILWDNRELLKYYSYLDNFLKELLIEVEKNNITLFITSDHGFNKTKKIIHINTYLKQKKFIINKELFYSKKNKITKEYISEMLLKYDLINLYKKFPIQIKQIIKRTIPGESDAVHDLKIDQSKAVMIGTGSIYINADNDHKKEKIIQSIINDLKDLKNQNTNEKVIEDIFRREDIYSGPFVNKAPDLLILPKKGYSFVQRLSDTVFEQPELTRGDHALNGIFLVYGPEIKKGFNIDAKIYDIAPTILHMFDTSIPSDMDGRVLKEIFEENSYFATKDIQFQERDLEKENIKKQIKKLAIIKKF